MFIDTSKLEVPVFYPTVDEFRHFSSYISKIESLGAHQIGLAKIIPPKEWTPRKLGYQQKQINETLVKNPIKQEIRGKNGIYSVDNIQQRSIKLNQFQRLASTHRYATPQGISHDLNKLEERYWQNLTTIAPIYGADVSGTFYDSTQTIWNVNNLGTILNDLENESGRKIEGVNTAYLYFGMWKTTFAWHTEDMDLYSINYVHFGASKQWYVIPPSFGKQFEKLASKYFPSQSRRCPAFLRHKMSIISPSILHQQSIPFCKIAQNQGEFIITFPYAYHSGFNYGFNCAESTNFALERWIEYGKHSIQCACRHDMVKIDMNRFVFKYQPDLYDDWIQQRNLTRHPEEFSSKSKAFAERQSLQFEHQQKIAQQRYASIFGTENTTSLVRAALLRAKISSKTFSLLNRTGKIIEKTFSSIESFRIFNGLEFSNEFREEILDGLWNFQSFHQPTEIAFNQWLTTQKSSCAICFLFSANQWKDQSFDILRFFFFYDENFSSTKQNESFLTCSQCQIRVHRQCYENICLSLNVPMISKLNPWRCQRCFLRAKSLTMIDDRCTSCPLRGGLVLQAHSSKTFTHAICSIAQAHRSTMTINEKIDSCFYCSSFTPLNYRRNSTEEIFFCSQSKCSRRFHLTCALLNGCRVHFDRRSKTIHFICDEHRSSIWNVETTTTTTTATECCDDDDEQPTDNDNDDDDEENDEDEEEEEKNQDDEDERVPVGTRVILHNAQVGHVLNNQISYHYAVDFGDGSYSHDMLAEDILDDNDPSTLTIGNTIRIRWTDGTIYQCKYLGRRRVLLYQIQLSNEICQLRRNEFIFDRRIGSDPFNSKDHYHRRQPISKRRKRRRTRTFGMTKKRRRHV